MYILAPGQTGRQTTVGVNAFDCNNVRLRLPLLPSNISEKRTYVFYVFFNFPVLCRPSILVYQRVNINGYLHMQGLNCSNARGDGTITSLERRPEIDQRRCNL